MKLQLGMKFGAGQLGNHFGSLRIFFMQGFVVGETKYIGVLGYASGGSFI
jgi:hypothetical protein